MLICLIKSKHNYLINALKSIKNVSKKFKFEKFNNDLNDASYGNVIIITDEKIIDDNKQSIIELEIPIDMNHLLQQIENISKVQNKIIKFNDIKLNTLTRMISYKNITVQLTNIEAKILYALISAEQNQLSKAEIKTNVLNYNQDAETSTIENHINHLRSKILENNLPMIISNFEYNYKLNKL